MSASELRDLVMARRAELETMLAQWVAIESVSADPTHAPDVLASAEFLAEACRHVGFPTVEVWQAGPAPAVFAEWPADDPSAPVVLVYGHHDVQPADATDGWSSPPFVGTLRGDEMFGRGASDDKGQIVFHLIGLAAHLQATGRSAPAVTLRLLVEGEEESGSPHLPDLLRAQRQRLAPDLIVVSDTSVFDESTPSVCVAMRGLVDCDVTLTGPEVDLHSGSFGGAVPNPLHALAELIVSLHDESGAVAIDGFYDDVAELTDADRELLARLPFDEAAWLSQTALSTATFGESGFSTLERIGARPTAEVNGAWGGHIGAGGKTIVPSSAHAKLSFRLVAHQDPADIQAKVDAHLRSHVPEGIGIEIMWHGPGVRPLVTGDTPALAAVRGALGSVLGSEVLLTREGGSGPEADLTEILGAPLVFLGLMRPGDRYHAPDERVSIPMLLAGAQAAAQLWQDLAELGRAGLA